MAELGQASEGRAKSAALAHVAGSVGIPEATLLPGRRSHSTLNAGSRTDRQSLHASFFGGTHRTFHRSEPAGVRGCATLVAAAGPPQVSRGGQRGLRRAQRSASTGRVLAMARALARL